MGEAIRRSHVTWTYDDYRLLPDDGKRYEVLDGDLVVSPAPSTTHQKVSKRIQHAFMLQIEEPGIGLVFGAPVDVIFSKTRLAQPDLIVISRERAEIIKERGIEGAPDLIVEILSPGTRQMDRTIKRKLYASEGTKEYWIVDPSEQTIEVLTLGTEDYTRLGLFRSGEKVVSSLFNLDLSVDAIFR